MYSLTDISDNIHRPFFTTKKGTAGTELGLNPKNDNVKADGSRLDINTQEGKGSVFVITLSAG